MMNGYYKIFLGLLLLTQVGCSTFPNPFRRETNEDYNALTYGEDYRERGGDWAPKKVRIDREDLYGSATPARERYQNSAEGELKNKATEPVSIYADEAMDAADASVQQAIMVSRGKAVADYKRGDRATREDFLDDAPNDGSLWSNENDANYFFTKGKGRTVGDIISIKAEEQFVKQIADEVKKSLTPAEQEVEMALHLKGADQSKLNQEFRSVASEDLKTSDATELRDKMAKAVSWSQVDLTKALALNPNEEIRAEVIDKYKNGNFKIRAVKRVLYRGSSKLVSMVAVAPAQDFDEKDSIPSGKLYEYKIKVAR
jgi:flagellar basal body L-ring protein FlgH